MESQIFTIVEIFALAVEIFRLSCFSKGSFFPEISPLPFSVFTASKEPSEY